MKMKKLTFEEIMAYDPRNHEIFDDLIKLQKEKLIIPFVGAGLSAFIFKTWKQFLEHEYSTYLPKIKMPENLLKAATGLYNELNEMDFHNDILREYGGGKGFDWAEKLLSAKGEAVELFPELFASLIVTTNFDLLLEKIYSGVEVARPSDYGALNRSLYEGRALLFKVHGSITNVEDIVFTEESYEKHYSFESPLVHSLSNVLGSKLLLFLGCSLDQDRTLDIWELISKQKIGLNHFTIINCSPDQREEKRRILAKKRIRAILYDDCGGNDFTATRTILEALFFEVNGYAFGNYKPLNNLPEQNKYFSGRTDQLKNINALFKQRENNAVNICQTVSGLGGVGKTQLALEYAHRYSSNFKSCIWFINAETATTTQNYFVAFANHFSIKLPPEFKSEELQEAVKFWLSENKEWLLIFDNLEFTDTIKPYLPDKINGRMLITTRNVDIDFGKQITLGVFNMDEALLFLKKRFSNDNELNMEFYTDNSNDFDSEAPKLIERLGFLPLALEQAAAYIKISQCTITTYLLLLSQSGLKAFEEKDANPEHYEKSNDFDKIVTATWSISFKAISFEGSRQLLNLCAYMAPDKIPVAFFAEMREKLPSPIKEDMAEEISKIRIVSELRKYSLTSGDAYFINVHRLVQEVVRKSHVE